ncbi:MAG: SDR family oxidoreductase [Eubacteriales bacterium]|jgi:short-subunit dehydrogenase|nr:SDR family oxidoreductase [Eubacteriales bacterium]
MKALITGASSGIGRDMAARLSKMGYDVILVARRRERLEELAGTLPTKAQIIVLDLSVRDKCFELYEKVKNEDIDILINNAGFGVFGNFVETDLKKELSMLDTNVTSLHILTKLFLKDFVAKDKGYILNVASAAAFLPGPLMAGYYASKAYVLRLTQSIGKELKKQKSKVYIGALCPGPVSTEFGKVANVSFGVRPLESMMVAKYAIEQMLRGKMVIVPGFLIKCCRIFSKLLPDRVLLSAAYHIQKGKHKR